MSDYKKALEDIVAAARLGCSTSYKLARIAEKALHTIDADEEAKENRFVMVVPTFVISCPHIYEVADTFETNRLYNSAAGSSQDPRYGLSLLMEKLPHSLRERWYKYEREGRITMQTHSRVPVECLDGPRHLVEALQEAEAMNKRRDSIFHNFRTARFHVESYNWKIGLEPVRFGLKLVRIDVQGRL